MAFVAMGRAPGDGVEMIRTGDCVIAADARQPRHLHILFNLQTSTMWYCLYMELI